MNQNNQGNPRGSPNAARPRIKHPSQMTPQEFARYQEWLNRTGQNAPPGNLPPQNGYYGRPQNRNGQNLNRQPQNGPQGRPQKRAAVSGL